MQEVQSIFEAQAEWKAKKLGKFSSSEMHRLLKSGKKKDQLFGDGAMTYIYEKVAELMTHQAKEEITGLKAIEHGNANEYFALVAYMERTGRQVEYFGGGNPKFFPYNEYSGGSPDFLAEDRGGEIKCPFVSSNHIEYIIHASKSGGSVHDTLWLKENHFDYFVQCQFNMMCCKRKKWDFISYDDRIKNPDLQLVILEINPDYDLQKDIDYRLKEAKTIIANILNTIK